VGKTPDIAEAILKLPHRRPETEKRPENRDDTDDKRSIQLTDKTVNNPLPERAFMV